MFQDSQEDMPKLGSGYDVLVAHTECKTQSSLPPKDLSSVFEEIAQQAQEQFDLGGGEQTPKRPPISIPSDSELVSVLDDARDNIMCDMHKNRDYYYLTCRVPKPRKESQVKPRAMMLRRRRIAKAKAIVGQLLGEAHGFTDAEVEELTLQYMSLSEQLVLKPGDDQQAKIATQTLLHMDCNVMSDQQVTNLLRASQHPWLTGAKLVKQRKELTQVIPKYGLEVQKMAKEGIGEGLPAPVEDLRTRPGTVCPTAMAEDEAKDPTNEAEEDDRDLTIDGSNDQLVKPTLWSKNRLTSNPDQQKRGRRG
eukprot:g23262.t1